VVRETRVVSRFRRTLAGMLGCWVLLGVVCAAHAQDIPPPQHAPDERFALVADTGRAAPSGLATAATFAAGALSGFLLHESGHVAANLMLGNVPRFQGMLVWGFVPFFAVSPDIKCTGNLCEKRSGQRFTPGQRGDVYIVTAGFSVQHLTDEFILGVAPDLANEYAPFRKGLLSFNILLSVLYAASAYAGVEDQHGDVHGMGRRLQVSDRWVATMLLLPAALDAYRYFYPYSTWAAWASRIVKASMYGVTFVF
jgi:hypothetical protein